MPDTLPIDLLEEFHAYLQQTGIPAQLIVDPKTLPLPSLLIQIPPDDKGEERWLSMTPIPNEDAFEEINLLQFYLPIFDPSEIPQPERYLSAINEKVVLGHAGIRPTGEVYIRYTWALPTRMTISDAVIFEVMQLFSVSGDMIRQWLRTELSE